MAAQSSVVQRFRVILPSGRLRHLAVDGRAFMADGRTVSHMVGLLRDMTGSYEIPMLVVGVLVVAAGAMVPLAARTADAARLSREAAATGD